VLQFRSEWIEVALEERAYVIRDRGARPVRLAVDPDYELVHLVTRYPKRYAGFVVQDQSQRVPIALDDASGRPLAETLVGMVRTPYLVDLLEERPQHERLRDLQKKRLRTADERATILDILTQITHPGETMGGTGIEQYFDPELAGEPGYRETQGLEDRREVGRDPIYKPPVDGADLYLTLDQELQRAAQDTLQHPHPLPPDEERPDRIWWRNPVGALALIRTNGEILAAASVPVVEATPAPGQDGERAVVRDRTLRKPRFQPPGSVFKPFVAAWALEYANLDPFGVQFDCGPLPGEKPRYGKVGCWKRGGHGYGVDLDAALVGSCNVYFAGVGEGFFEGADWRALADAFGFGEPTGVRPIPGRSGLLEEWAIRDAVFRLEAGAADVVRQRLGNGLSHITATPLQVARAYAGLATGYLPALTIAKAQGGVRPAERVPVSESALARVRASLERVVAFGTAAGKGLDVDSLGFRFAAKTGSADYRNGHVPRNSRASLANYQLVPGVRQHTWLAGFFPYEDPQLVLVVYVHDTSTTASHSAAYLGAQFLQTPAVRNYLSELGVTLSFPAQEER